MAESDKKPAEKAGEQKPKKSKKNKTRELVECLLVAGVLALGIRTFAFQLFKIPTRSMEPALIGNPDYGDRVVAAMWYNRGGSMLPLKLARPERWQVIVFRQQDNNGEMTNYIKRLVGLPGERVEIRDGDIWINGAIERKPPRVQEQLWTRLCDLDMKEPWKLPYYWEAGPAVCEDIPSAGWATGWTWTGGALVGASTAATPATLHWTRKREIDDRYIRPTVREVPCPNPECPGRAKEAPDRPFRFRAVFDTARPMAFCPKPQCRQVVWGVRDDGSPGKLVSFWQDRSNNDYWTEERSHRGSLVPDTRLVLDFDNLGSCGELQVTLTSRGRDYQLTLPLTGAADAPAVLAPPRGETVAKVLAAGGGRHRLEVAHVDGAFRAALDGDEISLPPYSPTSTGGAADAALSVRRGARVAVHRLQFFRDLYYTHHLPDNGNWPDFFTDEAAKSCSLLLTDGRTPGSRQYAFFGDNTLASSDSRIFGPKVEKDIVARGIFVAWPPSRFHLVW